jgi:hypothetical protein
MRKYFYALLFLQFFLFCPGTGNAQTLYEKPEDLSLLTKKFPKQEIADDMNFMLDVIRQAHPDMYHDISKKDLYAYRDDILSKLPDSISIYQASFAISPLSAALNEGHLGFVSGREEWKAFFMSKVRFPFVIHEVLPAALVVEKDLSGRKDLDPFDTILAINGIPVSLLVTKYEALGGGLDCWRRQQIVNYLPFWLFCDGIKAPYQVDVIHQGKRSGLEVPGALFSPSGTSNVSRPMNYRYQLLPDSIAYISWWQMTGYHNDFIHFLDSSFGDMKAKGISRLIIDVRNNGGGDSRFGDILLSYLTKKPYRMGAFSSFKLSRPSKEFQLDLVNSSYPRWVRSLIKVVPNGYMRNKEADVKKRKSREPFFTGQYCFLMSRRSFSSTNMMLGAIHDFGLGTLIGEPTCEPSDDYGEMMGFMLPNTHLIATTPSEYFTGPGGAGLSPNGVQPHIYVKPSREDILNGRDAAMERAREWVKEGK